MPMPDAALEAVFDFVLVSAFVFMALASVTIIYGVRVLWLAQQTPKLETD